MELRTQCMRCAGTVKEVPLLVDELVPPHFKVLILSSLLLLLLGNALHLFEQCVHPEGLWGMGSATSLGHELVDKLI